MALRERLGILLGLKVLAAATVAAVMLSGAPAKADGGVRIVLGFPARRMSRAVLKFAWQASLVEQAMPQRPAVQGGR
jgi:hypothetical protein